MYLLKIFLNEDGDFKTYPQTFFLLGGGVCVPAPESGFCVCLLSRVQWKWPCVSWCLKELAAAPASCLLGYSLLEPGHHALRKPKQAVEKPRWSETEAPGWPQLNSQLTTSISFRIIWVSCLGSRLSRPLSSCHLKQSLTFHDNPCPNYSCMS